MCYGELSEMTTFKLENAAVKIFSSSQVDWLESTF